MIDLDRERLAGMFLGWMLAFYGIRRRSWLGSLVAMGGLGLAMGAMTIWKLAR